MEKYAGTSGMPMPKKQKVSGSMKTVETHMGGSMNGVSLKPTTLKNVSTLKGTTNGKNPGNYGKKSY